MGVNKVIFGNVTLIDTSEVSVTPEKMFEGETALGADGEIKTGTFTIDSELTEQDSLLSELEAALEGKAGWGEAEAGTCTLTITLGSYIESLVIYVLTVNGYEYKRSSVEFQVQSGITLVFENVIAGSTVIIDGSGRYDTLYFDNLNNIEIIDDLTVIQSIAFLKCTTPNSNATLRVYSKD